MNKSIPIFNDLKTGAQALDWLQTVNRVANLHRRPDNFKLQSVRANLAGAAQQWFASRDIEKWIDFERQFHRTFVGTVMTGDRWKEMCCRVQFQSENVQEYFHEKVHLCKLDKMSFHESKMKILEGLISKDLSIYLLGRDYEDEDELLRDMVEYQRLEKSRTMRIRQSAGVKDSGQQKLNTSQQNNVLPPVLPKKYFTKTTDHDGGLIRSCYNCGSKT